MGSWIQCHSGSQFSRHQLGVLEFNSTVTLTTWNKHQEKAMAPHSSTLAWKIPQREDPGGLQSTESRKVRHD